MVMIKGATFNSTLDFNKEILGEEAVNSLIAQLDDESRKVLSKTILDTSWYPVDPLNKFSELAFNKLLGKNINAFKKGSKLISEKQLTTVHKAFLSAGSIENLIRQINSINGRYFQGIEVITEYLDSNKLKVTYRGFEKKDWIQEITTIGWWEVIFQQLKAKNPTAVITTSLAEDKGYFDFIITWGK